LEVTATSAFKIINLPDSLKDTSALSDHFRQFGGIESVQLIDGGSAAVVRMDSRRSAELAIIKGSTLPDSFKLIMQWHSGPTTRYTATTSAGTATAATPAAPASSAPQLETLPQVNMLHDIDGMDVDTKEHTPASRMGMGMGGGGDTDNVHIDEDETNWKR
jgi:hypothetical protein